MSSEKKEILATLPQLRDVIDQIMIAHKWTQEDLAKAIGVNQSMVSKMRWGPKWEKHWRTFLRLLEYAEEAEVFNDYFARMCGDIRRRLSPHAQRQFDSLLSQATKDAPPPRTEGGTKSRHREAR